MKTLKLVNIEPDDYILAIKAAKSFVNEQKPNGIRHGTIYSYWPGTELGFREAVFYVYYTNAGTIVVRYSR